MNEMSDKIILITGSTNGIGEAAALELAKKGPNVIIVGRNQAKTSQVVQQVRDASGNPKVDGLVADLSSMSEVRKLANMVHQKYQGINILINNAGGIYATRTLTADGYEYTFALNHLSYFLLTNLLLDLLIANAPSRIINVSSRSHEGAVLNFDDLQNSRQYGFGGYRAYGQSKLENLLFTYELARRLDGTRVTVNALHPGTVATGFGENNTAVMKLSMQIFHQFSLTPEQGADTVVYLASSPEVEGISGKYWTLRKPVPSSPESNDEGTQKRLWAISAQLTSLPEAVPS
jgi:NAD(P)-dependent dehydrogenase (short-subunit alcohol dehydrogenase family)